MSVRSLAAISLLTLAMSAFSMTQSASTCQGSSLWSSCSATSNGSQVDVSGTTTSPPSSNGSKSPDGGPGTTAPTPTPSPTPSKRWDPDDPFKDRGDYQVVMLPRVTASDLASFVPDTPTAAGEPAGLGVVGMPTNLLASASEQTLTGRLFEYDVQVRFVPRGFRFDYGDGTSRTTTTGGASWARLGLAPYSPTATSHTYSAPGSYRVTVSTIYDAFVHFGIGTWRPVTGPVTSPAATYDVRIVEISTALVLRTCAEDPRGPGC